MTVKRGTSNGNESGSSYARRARKRRMLAPYGGHGGNGRTVPCYRCQVDLTFATLTVDRIVAGMDGGTYSWDNVRPACGSCNIKTGNQLRDHRRKFPKGAPVVFARNRMFFTADKVLWDIVYGESEDLLILCSRASGRHRYKVDRRRLMAVTDPTALELAA